VRLQLTFGHLAALIASEKDVILAHALLDIVCQLAPSDTSRAHRPATEAKIAVPAAPPANGTTLEDAEVTVFPVVLTLSHRPGNDPAAGRVTVQAALKIISLSVANTV
jgi:hypothetical protein